MSPYLYLSPLCHDNIRKLMLLACLLAHMSLSHVSVTFDILTEDLKMSANYLHTMNHIPSFTSLLHYSCQKSPSQFSFQKGNETPDVLPIHCHTNCWQCESVLSDMVFNFNIVFLYRLWLQQTCKCEGDSGEHDRLIWGLQKISWLSSLLL